MIITDEQEYRSHPAPNYSSLKHILASPKHYQAALRKPVEPSKSMLLGTMLHSKVLESRDYPVAVMPEGLDGRTKEGRAWKEANAGREVISNDDYQQYKRMADAVAANKDVQYLLGKCHMREVGIVQKYRGIEIKGKIDAIGKDENGNLFVFDLKTTQSAEPHEFSRSASNFKYWFQCVFYTALIGLEFSLESRCPWYWVVVENSEAADVVIYQPPPEAIEIGQAQMDKAIDLYIECTTTGKWPGYGGGILELEIPAWERRKWLNT